MTVGSHELDIVPVTLRRAQAFVAEHHRHNSAPRGHKFSIGLARGDELVGVLICGRPIARSFDDGFTIEVARTCLIDGVGNGNSMLYGAAWKAARAMGYRRIITYTQQGESGSSLRAAGYRVIAERPARASWAESSVKLRDIRDPVGSGGFARTLWDKTAE